MTYYSPNHYKEVIVKAELHILNLEDNEQDAELNATTLSEFWPQCEFRRVDNRRDFTAALETQEPLDLILSDYTMPGFNGVQALTLARENVRTSLSSSNRAPLAKTRPLKRSKTARPIMCSRTGSRA